MISPKLQKMFDNRRSEEQAKRDSHYRRFHTFHMTLEAQGTAIEELRGQVSDFIAVASYDEWALGKSDLLKLAFKELRHNMAASRNRGKGWADVYEWLGVDARQERDRQEEACDIEAHMQARHERSYAPVVL